MTGWIQRALDRVGAAIDDTGIAFEAADGPRWTVGQRPRVTVRLKRAAVMRRIMRDPLLAFGETWVDGDWEVEDGSLLDVLEVCHRVRKARATGGHRAPGERLVALLASLNGVNRARHNVEHHYDLDNDLFRSFLDEDMHYSCAYFAEEGMSLESAQQAKCGHIARKLDLRPGARVLDVGCGFASCAMYLAEHHQVHVTGITLSRNQLEEGRRRVRERGLDGRVELRLEDYRETAGEFDAIVSIGMFEHVGMAQYTRFFTRMRELLRPDGTMLLHTIGVTAPPGPVNPWIRKYIFPGGYLPSASQLTAAIERAALGLCDLEVLRRHYAMTLAEWNRRFQAAWPRLSRRFDERFRRMWTFYLTASEAGFRWNDLVVYQAQIARDPARLPVTRGYMYR